MQLIDDAELTSTLRLSKFLTRAHAEAFRFVDFGLVRCQGEGHSLSTSASPQGAERSATIAESSASRQHGSRPEGSGLARRMVNASAMCLPSGR